MKRRFKNKEYSTSKPSELLHTYLPTRTNGLNRESYFMLLIDEYSKMTWVTLWKEQFKAFEKFKVFNSVVENQVDTIIKCLKYDKGGEFTLNEFNKFYEKRGIRRHFSDP